MVIKKVAGYRIYSFQLNRINPSGGAKEFIIVCVKGVVKFPTKPH